MTAPTGSPSTPGSPLPPKQPPSSSAQDQGDAGIAYTFRVRATDNVGNVSGWVQSASVAIDAVTKYYHHGSSQDHGGARVAMRQGGEVYYLYGDHLGPTSLTTDDQGTVVREARYLLFGKATGRL